MQPAPLESPLLTTTIKLPAPPPAAKTKTVNKPTAQLPKVALLFLTRGPMPLESIWRDFLGVEPMNTARDTLKDSNTTAAWQKYFSVYVHAAPGFVFSEESFFGQFSINKPVQAEWGKHSIIDAERKLVQASLRDPLNSFFILLSETHVPLYSAAATYLQLATAKHSRVHACGNSSDEDDAERRMVYRMSWEMRGNETGITEDTWRKSSQWFGLIRSHAQLFAKERIVNAAFDQFCYVEPNEEEPGEFTRFCVSDEHYIPTMLSIHKLEKECDCDGHMTRVVWSGNYMHPKTFGKVEATMETLRHELRGESECRHGRVLERLAELVLQKIDKLMIEGVVDIDGDVEEEEEEIDTEHLTGVEIIEYAMKQSKAVVMNPSCPLFARKIEKEAEVEWRELLKTVLKPVS